MPTKFEEFTEALATKLIAAMETADGNWTRGWVASGGLPRNVATGKTYSGGNALMLMLLDRSSHWATYKQWAALGGQVRKGEKSATILVPIFKKDDDGESKMVGFRTASVFSADQQDGWTPPALPSGADIDANAEAFFAAQGVTTTFGGDRACYSPIEDRIYMPLREAFTDTGAFYGTLAHEHAHATGHDSRLGRALSGKFGSNEYQLEELTAEMTSAFCLAHLGLSAEPRPDHALYLKSWVKALHGSPKAAWTAAGAATTAFSYLMGKAGQSMDSPALVEYSEDGYTPAA